MVKLIANRRMRYGTRRLQAGDLFEARPKDARILVLLNRADKYVEPVKKRGKKESEPVREPVVEPVFDPVVDPVAEVAEADDEPAVEPDEADDK